MFTELLSKVESDSSFHILMWNLELESFLPVLMHCWNCPWTWLQIQILSSQNNLLLSCVKQIRALRGKSPQKWHGKRRTKSKIKHQTLFSVLRFWWRLLMPCVMAVVEIGLYMTGRNGRLSQTPVGTITSEFTKLEQILAKITLVSHV